MYALVIPPALVSRLYRLREHHGRGPIRRQILKAVERYLDETEQELTGNEPAATSPGSDPQPATYQSKRERNSAAS